MGRTANSEVITYKAVPELNCQRVELYEHNVKTYNKFVKALIKNDILAVVQATGTGKSFIFMKFIQDLILNNNAYTPIKIPGTQARAAKRIVVVVPNDSLRVGYEEYPEWDSRVEVVTYQKLSSMYEKNKSNPLISNGFNSFFSNVSLLIFDEMHRTGADKWGEACKYASDLLLRRAASQRIQIDRKIKSGTDEYDNALLYKCDKVLGFTATPIRDLDNNRDMVEEMFRGNCVTGPDLSEAVTEGILPKFSYHSLLRGSSEEKVRNSVKRAKEAVNSGIYEEEKTQRLREYIHSIELNMENSRVIEDNLRKIISNNKCQKWVVFCSNTEEMNSVDDELNNWFSCVGSAINIYQMSSTDGEVAISKKDNTDELKRFISAESGVNILKVINMLNEGVHVKGIDGAILMRGTNSLIMYLQQIGRVLSASGKHKTPIVIDFMGNYLNIQEKMNGSARDKFKRENLKITHYIGKMCCSNNTDTKDNVVGMQCVNIFNGYYNIEKELKASRIWTEDEERIVLKNGNNTQQSYNELLGIGNNRTLDAVKAKWRELATKYNLEYDSGNRLSDKEKMDMLYKHIAEGKTCEEVADELGCDIGRVATYLNKCGVNNDVKARAEGFSAIQFADMIQMRSNGAGWKKIADRYDTSDYIIRTLFKRAGMESGGLEDFGKKRVILNKTQITFMKQCIGKGQIKYGTEVLGINLATIRECFDRQGEVWEGLSGGDIATNITDKNAENKKKDNIKEYYKDTKITVKARNNIAKSFENCGGRMDKWAEYVASQGKKIDRAEEAIKLLRDTDSFRNRQSYKTLCNIYNSWRCMGNQCSVKDRVSVIANRTGISNQTVYNAAVELGLIS